MCFKSRVKKGMIDGENGSEHSVDCGSDVCRVVRRRKTRMWMKLMERCHIDVSQT